VRYGIPSSKNVVQVLVIDSDNDVIDSDNDVIDSDNNGSANRVVNDYDAASQTQMVVIIFIDC